MPYIFSESPEKPKTAAKKRKSSPVAKSTEKPSKKVKEEVKEEVKKEVKKEAKEKETTPDNKSDSDKKKRRSQSEKDALPKKSSKVVKKEEENNDMETTSEVEIKAEPETKLNKVKVTAGKKSKKSQKEELADELKALAEEANEADIEMKLEPNSEEKTSETFAQYNEKRTVFPQGFWTEPTAVMPKDKTQYPDFPNIEGLSKEEADCAIIEFWKKIKEKREQGKQNAQERKRLIKSYEPKKNSKIRIPKDKSEFDEISKVLIGFPSTEGLSEEVARSVIMEYWMNQGLTRHGINYSIIPNDLGRYPGFPKTEGLPQEEVDEVVKKFWMEWQKNKTVFPKAFWEEPTALVPKDLRHHPGFPNTEGLSKEEADRAIIEYWKKEKLNKEQRKRDKKKMKNNRQREFEEKFKK